MQTAEVNEVNISNSKNSQNIVIIIYVIMYDACNNYKNYITLCVYNPSL